MNNFEYYNPVRYVFGQGQVDKLSSFIPEGTDKVMLLYGGGSIKKNNCYEEVKAALKSYDLIEFGGIKSNPSIEYLSKAIEMARVKKVDFLLAIGGGSIIDATKFLSLAIPYPNDPWDILDKKDINFSKAIPLGAILTLPATGSEMNMFSVISREETQEKRSFAHPLVFPKFSIVDPSYTLTLDDRQIGNGVVDAFVHVMEQYMTYPVGGMIQDQLCEGVLKTLMEVGPKALKDKQDLLLRKNISWSASLALSTLLGMGAPQDWSTHAIGHELTAFFGIDHARTLALVFPANMAVRIEQKREKLALFARNVLGHRGEDSELALMAIKDIQKFFEEMGLPTKIKDYDIEFEQLKVVQERFAHFNEKGLGERQDVTYEIIGEILELAFD